MRGLSIIALARFVRVSSARSDRGAISSIVAVLLGGGVVMGSAALSIDVGQLMWARRQLQNGADAVSLSVAQTCAKSSSMCLASLAADPTVAALNASNDNAYHKNGSGSAANTGNGLESLCGNPATVPPLGPPLATCAAPPAPPAVPALVDCPRLPAYLAANPSIPYVEARTRTGSGSLVGSILPFVAQAGGTTVKACARTAWGEPGPYSASVPVTFSDCEWKYNTGGSGAYYKAPEGAAPGYGGALQTPWPVAAVPGAPSLPGAEIIIMLQSHGTTVPCTDRNGHDVPGGFGYLESSSGCSALVSAGGWVQVQTGISTPCDLNPLVGTVISLPVFDCVVISGSVPTSPLSSYPSCSAAGGSNTWYHMAGWARFYLSGFKTGGSPQDQRASLVPPYQLPCSGGDRCLAGWFVQGSLNATSISGPPGGSSSFGTYTALAAG